MPEPRQGRHIQKKSLLTKLEILFDRFLQICRADGAGNGAVWRSTRDKINHVRSFIVATQTGKGSGGFAFCSADS
jgi:hypothetical protein